MRAILFRRLEVDGKNYYQLFRVKEDFENSPEFSSFSEYEDRANSDYFFMPDVSDEDDKDDALDLGDVPLYGLFYDGEKDIEQLQDEELFKKVFEKFDEKFHVTEEVTEKYKIKVETEETNEEGQRILSSEEIAAKVREFILFQDYPIRRLCYQIALNQMIMRSDMPYDLKLTQKSNVLFCGAKGSGKKKIIELIEDLIPIPFVDFELGPDPDKDIDGILGTLIKSSRSDEEASCGVVFIRDKFEDVIKELVDEASASGLPVDTNKIAEKVASIPTYFAKQGLQQYIVDGEVHNIDMSTLTYVVLYDKTLDYSPEKMRFLAGCDTVIETNKLTVDQKYEVLTNENGRIKNYDGFLQSCGQKVEYDEKALKKLIEYSSRVEDGMYLLNKVIDEIIRYELSRGIIVVNINEENVDAFIPVIERLAAEKEGPKNEMITLKEAFEKVTKHVVGQDKQVKTILHTILKNLKMAQKEDLTNSKAYIKNILIRGKSGSGKSFTVEQIAKVLGVPYCIVDSTKLTGSGWKGEDIENAFVNLIRSANGNIEEAQRGIVVYSEIDKNAEGKDEISGPGKKNALDGMLKAVEGTVMPVNIGSDLDRKIVMFDTSRVTFCCEGAFEGIEEYQKARLKKNKQMGFGGNLGDEIIKEPLIDEDYFKFGMTRQFIARFPVMIELNEVTEEQLINIMKKSESSALKIEKAIIEVDDIEVEYTDDFYEAVAKAALELKIGVRGISKVLERVLASIGIEDIDPNEVSKIILKGSVLTDPNTVELIPRKKQRVKRIVKK